MKDLDALKVSAHPLSAMNFVSKMINNNHIENLNDNILIKAFKIRIQALQHLDTWTTFLAQLGGDGIALQEALTRGDFPSNNEILAAIAN